MTSMWFVLIHALSLGLIVEIAANTDPSDCSTNFPGSASCDRYHDGAAFLQAMQSRSQQTLGADRVDLEILSQGAEKALRAGCNVTDLNNGACIGNDVCVGCNLPGAQGVLPQTEDFFPNREFRCEGNRTCSQVVDSPFTFASAGQAMVCIGDATCTDVWFVSNVGAVCCSSANDGDTCSNSSFNLTVNDVICQNDVCCDGTRVCTNSTMYDVESLLCRGLLACSDSQVILEQDLYCNATSESNPSSSGSTCSDSTFTFVVNDTHVVDCLGDFVCENSNFSFNQDSAINFDCDSEAPGTGGGQGACNNATINLAPGACFELNCIQDDDCIGLVVNLFGGKCYFNMFNQENRPNFVDVCDKFNSTGLSPCGPITPQEICCRDDPSCASCCVDINITTTSANGSGFPPTSSTSTTSTTSTTTTTTTTIYPRNRRNRRNRREHRRNRRQNRRNRRQHARQYRYS